MVKPNKIKKHFFYKQAAFTQPTTDTLQNLLAKALKKFKAKQRHEITYEANINDVDAPPQEWLRFVNSPRALSGFQFGVLLLYSPGLHHMAVEHTDEEKDELDVTKLAPPLGKRFMESPLYFGVRDNHVVLIQSKSLRNESLESHLNWLLHESGVLVKGVNVKLTDTIPNEVKKKLSKNSIKRIALQAPFFEYTPADPAKKSPTEIIKSAAGIGMSMLKAVLPDAKYDALSAKELMDTKDIRLTFEIKVVGRHADVSDNDVMRSLMEAMRHVDDPDMVFAEVKGVGTVKGSLMRVHDSRTVAAVDGVLVLEDAYEAMRQWLESLIDTGAINSDH
ncbi:hypothetical protein [Massilia sp. BKSP1R2A-1]|uniref:hypothetical protein n=1 Tax=Massilia sp. BKSP1R2A-1 TaxID=3422595 RepID=UPI003D347E8B